MTLKERRDALQARTFTMMFRVLVYFGLPSIAGYFLGKYLDEQVFTEPTGTLLSMGLSFVFSWALVFRLYASVMKEYRELEELEREEEENKEQQ